MPNEIKKPSIFLHLTELIRAIYENIKGNLYISSIPKQNFGKNRLILVIPGLLSTDWYTTFLRKYLNKIGFRAFGWGLGRNLGRQQSITLLNEKVLNLQKQYDQKIIIIGWSMGGIFAREVGKAIPDSIEKIITIGSPFANLEAPNHARWVYDLLNSNEPIDQQFINQVPVPASMPTFALYSKLDGMVPWQACMEIEDVNHKNIEVASSHFGMGGNPNVLKAVGEILK
jgi:pimeloyl-ACP methyl ester carboxylesterase